MLSAGKFGNAGDAGKVGMNEFLYVGLAGVIDHFGEAGGGPWVFVVNPRFGSGRDCVRIMAGGGETDEDDLDLM